MSRAAPPQRPNRRARWRAAGLIAVYLLMGVHLAHWKLNGRTLAPLELNEVMHTLELGIVTAGFLFMATAVLATAIFGRFFCSWGCHILALQDLCAWLLQKLRVRPRPLRSRVLRLVAPSAMIYMFIWPQISRLVQGRELPQLRVVGEGEGWASFVTSDYWRNLPGPGIALLTFAICGFAIVYLLGSRSFCRYACPYGVIFGLADRVAPGRIVARGDCSSCGLCTAACQSHIRVHEELTVFGKIVNSNCLKDLDCVSTCPEGVIGYGFTRPSFLGTLLAPKAKREAVGRPGPNVSLAEEALMALVFLITLLAYRGLYGTIPFLMTLGLGAISAYAAVLGWRLWRARDVRLNSFQLKRGGRLGRSGAVAAALLMCFGLLTAHSAFIRLHEHQGRRAAERARATGATGDLASAIDHLELAHRYGLYRPAPRRQFLADLHMALGERQAGSGAFEEAAGAFARAAELRPDSAPPRYNRGVMLAQLGRSSEAIDEYRAALRLDPNDPEIHNNLGFLLGALGRRADAVEHLRAAVGLDPDYPHARFNLGRLLLAQGAQEEARIHLERAAALDVTYRSLLRAPARSRPQNLEE